MCSKLFFITLGFWVGLLPNLGFDFSVQDNQAEVQRSLWQGGGRRAGDSGQTVVVAGRCLTRDVLGAGSA